MQDNDQNQNRRDDTQNRRDDKKKRPPKTRTISLWTCDGS